MGASKEQRVDSPECDFFERPDRLEGHHRRLQCKPDSAGCKLDCTGSLESVELRDCWRHNCQVIAELDQAGADCEPLRTWMGPSEQSQR
jgi:hypothetical protein